MIMSFSVPDNPKYRDLINWYNEVDKQERSREFREIFLSYFKKPRNTMDIQEESRISPRLEEIELERINIVSEDVEADLDLRLDSIGTSLS